MNCGHKTAECVIGNFWKCSEPGCKNNPHDDPPLQPRPPDKPPVYRSEIIEKALREAKERTFADNRLGMIVLFRSWVP